MNRFQHKPIPEMWPAIHEMIARKIRFRVCSPGHIKIGAVNYWPSTGRIHIDGTIASLPQTGLTQLLNLLESTRLERRGAKPSPEELRSHIHVVRDDSNYRKESDKFSP